MVVDMVIKNGTIVLPHSSLRAHLIIHEGKIKEMTVFDELPETQQTIDATGLAKHGDKIRMPPREELIDLERKSGVGPLTVP